MKLKQAGFVNPSLLAAVVVAVGAALALSACGALNAGTSAKLNIVESDYKGLKANVERVDDETLSLWLDSSCDIKLGAIQRKPSAIGPLMEACPVTGMASVNVNNGAVSLKVPSAVNLSVPAAPVAASPQPSVPAVTTIQFQQFQQQVAQKIAALADAIKAPAPPSPPPRVVTIIKRVPVPVTVPLITAPVPVPIVKPTSIPQAAPANNDVPVAAPVKRTLLSPPVVPGTQPVPKQ